MSIVATYVDTTLSPFIEVLVEEGDRRTSAAKPQNVDLFLECIAELRLLLAAPPVVRDHASLLQLLLRVDAYIVDKGTIERYLVSARALEQASQTDEYSLSAAGPLPTEARIGAAGKGVVDLLGRMRLLRMRILNQEGTILPTGGTPVQKKRKFITMQ